MQTERKQKQAVMRILLLKSNLGERTVSFAEMDRAVSAENKKSDGIDVETEDLVAELEAQGVFGQFGVAEPLRRVYRGFSVYFPYKKAHDFARFYVLYGRFGRAGGAFVPHRGAGYAARRV